MPEIMFPAIAKKINVFFEQFDEMQMPFVIGEIELGLKSDEAAAQLAIKIVNISIIIVNKPIA